MPTTNTAWKPRIIVLHLQHIFKCLFSLPSIANIYLFQLLFVFSNVILILIIFQPPPPPSPGSVELSYEGTIATFFCPLDHILTRYVSLNATQAPWKSSTNRGFHEKKIVYNKSLCSPLPLACIDGKRWNGSAPQCELVTTPVPGAIITFLLVHSLSYLSIFQLSTGETCSSLRSPPPPQSSPQSSSLPLSSPSQVECKVRRPCRPSLPLCGCPTDLEDVLFLSTLTAVKKYGGEWQKTTVVKVNVEKLLTKRK